MRCVVMSGYSQGAQVTHKAAAQVSDKTRVVAIVLFGDPQNGQAISGFASSKVKTFCASGRFLQSGREKMEGPWLMIACDY